MEISAPFIITLISSIVASAVQLTVFAVLYKTLKAIHIQNTNYEKSFKTNETIQKNLLTFRFADWLSSEIKYYSPLYKANQGRDYILTGDEINDHLVAMAKKLVTLINQKVVDASILRDEIERSIATLDNMESKPLDIIVDLKKLL